MVRQRYSRQVVEGSAAKIAGIAGESRLEKAYFLIIPSRALWRGGNEPVQRRIHGELVDALTGFGLDVIDMRPHFERSGSPLSYHFDTDGHWNDEGHKRRLKYCTTTSRDGHRPQ